MSALGDRAFFLVRAIKMIEFAVQDVIVLALTPERVREATRVALGWAASTQWQDDVVGYRANGSTALGVTIPGFEGRGVDRGALGRLREAKVTRLQWQMDAERGFNCVYVLRGIPFQGRMNPAEIVAQHLLRASGEEILRIVRQTISNDPRTASLWVRDGIVLLGAPGAQLDVAKQLTAEDLAPLLLSADTGIREVALAAVGRSRPRTG